MKSATIQLETLACPSCMQVKCLESLEGTRKIQQKYHLIQVVKLNFVKKSYHRRHRECNINWVTKI